MNLDLVYFNKMETIDVIKEIFWPFSESKNEEGSCDPVLNESKECISSTFCVAVGKNKNFCRFAGSSYKFLEHYCTLNI